MEETKSITSTMPTTARDFGYSRDAADAVKDYTTAFNVAEIKAPRFIKRLLNQLYMGLFGLLFALQRKSKGVDSLVWVVALEVFEMLQMLSFPFRKPAHFPWNAQHTDWWITFVNATVPESLIAGNALIFYVVIALLGAVMINAFTVGYYFAQNQYKFVWTLRYIRIVCILFMTILYIPVIALLTSMLRVCGGMSCWSGPLLARSVLVLIVGFLYIMLTLTFALSVFQQDPHDKSEVLSRPHSRCEVYHLVMKTILTIMFTILEHESTYQWLLAILCLLASGSSWGIMTYYIPLYRWDFALFRSSILATFFWASICLVIVLALQDHHNSITIMFFFVLPFVIVVSIHLMSLRRDQIKKMPITTTTNALEVELKVRFLLEQHCLLFNKSYDASDKLILDQATAIYAEAAKLLPNSSILYMFWSNYCLHHCNNKQRSLVVLAECTKRSPQIDELFVAYRQRKIMNEESGGENIDMLDFIMCEAHLKRAMKHERKAVMLQLQFWAELCQKSADLQKLFVLGSQVNYEVYLTDTHYQKALTSNPKAVNVLKNYSNFLADICNDQKKAVELSERAMQLEDLRRRGNTGDGAIDINNVMNGGGNDMDTAIFTINHQGTIISVNSGVISVLKYDRPQSLLGRNISSIVPPPFDKIHDNFLNKYMNVGEGQIMGKLRKVFGIRADGYLIPVMILVRQLTFGTNATFLGALRLVPEGSFTYDYVLLDENGFIKCFTERCTEYFGTTPFDVQRYQMHISDWIENFDELSEEMKKSGGCRFQIEMEDKNVDLNCTQHNTTISGISISMLKIVDVNNIFASGLRNDGGVGDIRGEMPMMFYADANKLKKKPVDVVKEESPKKSQSQDKQTKKEREKKKSGLANVVTTGGNNSDTSSTGPAATPEPGKKSDKRKLRDRSYSHSSHQSRESGGLRSAHSGESQTSTVMNQMVRGTFARRVGETALKLKKFRFVLLLVFVATFGLTLGTGILLNQTFDNYVENLADLFDAGKVYVGVVVLIQKLLDISSAATAELGRHVLDYSNNLNWIYFGLYNSSGYLANNRGNIFTRSSLVSPTGALSLNDLFNLFTSQVALKAKEHSGLSVSTGGIDFLSTSRLALETLDAPLFQLLTNYLEQWQENVAASKSVLYPSLLAPIVSLYIICVLVLIYIFIRTNSESKIIYRLFLDVPKETINEMYAKAQNKLQQLDAASDRSFIGDEGLSSGAQQMQSSLFDMDAYLKEKSITKDKQSEIRASGYELQNLKRLFLRLLLFIAVTLPYYVGFAVYSNMLVQKTQSDASFFVWSFTSQRYLQEANLRLRLVEYQLARGNYTELQGDLLAFTKSVRYLDSFSDSIFVGNKTMFLNTLYENIREAPLAGFPDFSQVFPLLLDDINPQKIDDAECDSGLNQVMAHGILNAIDESVSLAMKINGEIPITDLNATLAFFETEPEVELMNKYATQCIPKALEMFNAHIFDPVHEARTALRAISISVTILLILLIFALYYFGFRPVLNSMEQEVSLTPSMLLMLPAQILLKVESIRKFTSENQ